tara:strand:- start:43103 stop:43756 length:654 start_codon:yes stop_codon:yes gene_type:complete
MNLKKHLAIIAFGCFALALHAQDSGVVETKANEEITPKEKSIKPLRIGGKFGVPSLLTASAEYVTPLLNNRISFAIDYFAFDRDFDGTNVDYTNFEIGTNIYVNPRGKGFYGGISYTSFSSEGSFVDVEFDDENFTVGDGKANIDYNTLNLKLGLKLGRVFYFRIEAGYGFGTIPTEVVVRGIDDPNLTSVEEIPDIPGLSDSGLIYFNIGFGIGFL